MNRRDFLGGMLAAAIAPAFVKTAGLLMPVKPIVEIANSEVVKLIEARMNDAGDHIARYLNVQLWTGPQCRDDRIGLHDSPNRAVYGGRIVIPVKA